MTRDTALNALEPFVGEWDMVGTHPRIKAVIKGSATVEWLEGRSFLIWRQTAPPDTVPPSISIIGGGETPATWPMHYFDSRGVFRVYQVTIADGVWKIWRDHPGFDQRATGVFSEGGRVFRLRSELNEGAGFRPDLEQTFHRRR